MSNNIDRPLPPSILGNRNLLTNTIDVTLDQWLCQGIRFSLKDGSKVFFSFYVDFHFAFCYWLVAAANASRAFAGVVR